MTTGDRLWPINETERLTDPSKRRFVFSAAAVASYTIGASSLGLIARASAAGLPSSVAGVTIPDTDLAKAAAALARASCSPPLFNHCMRTYVFGSVIGRRKAQRFDPENLFVAAALHDLGLVAPYASKDQPFELDSADAAKEFLVKRGVPEARVSVIWDAIAMHTSAISDRKQPDIALLGDGAGMDVFGTGSSELRPETIAAIFTAYPRLRFGPEFEKLIQNYCVTKARAQVGTWTDAYCRTHGHGTASLPNIGDKLRNNPFEH